MELFGYNASMLMIDTLKKEQLPLLFKYSLLEKWSVEQLHVECQYKIYPTDFFVAYKQRELVGFILAIRHSESFGFISNFIILKRFRGNGFGKELFKYAMDHLGQRQIALDSIKGKEKFDKEFGFTSYLNVNVSKFIVGSITLPSSHIKSEDFDDKLSLVDLNTYMQCIVTDESIKYQAVKKADKITSYGLCFTYNDGYKVVLNSEEINEAITLFFELIKGFQIGTLIYMQVSKLHPLLLSIEELLNMKIQIQYSRMYNKIID